MLRDGASQVLQAMHSGDMNVAREISVALKSQPLCHYLIENHGPARELIEKHLESFV
jgi:hypothetical protein